MASAVGERFPAIGASLILMPRCTIVRTVLAEERACPVFFAAATMERNIGVLFLGRKPSSAYGVAERDAL
jgi:hypothetical protein